MKFVTVGKNDVSLIAKVESMGTWECGGSSFDIWEFNGVLFKIPKTQKNNNLETL